MIRAFDTTDLPAVMQIWLETNIQAHDFIPQEYWTGNFELVKDMLPQAEIYVHVNDTTHQIDGFIGLADEYIEGIFVQKDTQSHGVGRQLLEYAKQLKPRLSLHVYQENHRAVRFYQREQFTIESEGVDDATGQSEYVMVWEHEHHTLPA
ncbi:GNAT family N-acetyltransferase [Collinsella provencensis]|uniref:GNAT family N-acetyltransferase n=1 Tax=Collinsella provencensis TaxID=1937461 RepID=UPI0018FF0250|nr:GNAT family N-acetyltransferase [Collinsella provencensis]